MSGLVQRTKDRDGAPVDGRGVTPRAAGVALPARGLAQIAEIAQISKTSMDWASVRERISPQEFAQIAVISLRSPGQPLNMWGTNFGLLENAKTGNAERGLRAGRSNKFLAVSPFTTARRLGLTEMNFNPWWTALPANTNDSKNAGGNAANAETPGDTMACVVRRRWERGTPCRSWAVCSATKSASTGPAEIPGIRKSPKRSTKWASARCRAVWRKSKISPNALSPPRGEDGL